MSNEIWLIAIIIGTISSITFKILLWRNAGKKSREIERHLNNQNEKTLPKGFSTKGEKR